MLLFEITISLFSKNTKNIPYCIASLILTALIFLCWSEKINNNLAIACICFVSYFIIEFIIKCILTRLVLKEKPTLNAKKLINLLFYQIQLFLISPDYIITELCKDVFWQTEKTERKKLIQLFNIINLVFSALLIVLVCCFAGFNLCPTFTKYLIGFLIVRIVSRSIEIIISFLNDISKNEGKKSSLGKHSRIELTFSSILELMILSFGINYSCNVTEGVAKAALDALKIVSNFPSSISNVAEIAATFCALGCFV